MNAQLHLYSGYRRSRAGREIQMRRAENSRASTNCATQIPVTQPSNDRTNKYFVTKDAIRTKHKRAININANLAHAGKALIQHPPQRNDKDGKSTQHSTTRKKRFSNFHFWKIGQVNIRTGREDFRIEEAIRQMHRAKLSICCFQEVRRLNSGDLIHKVDNQEYQLFYNGYKRKHEAGVAIVVKTDQNVQVLDVINTSARLMAMNIIFYGYKIRIISAYAPTNCASDNMKTQFYRELKKSVTSRESNQKLLLCGDFNATSTIFEKNVTFRERSIIPESEKSNDNGERLLKFTRDQGCCIMNTFFQQKKTRKITWISNDDKTTKCIDFILCDPYTSQYFKNVRVASSYDFNSDHRLLVGTLLTPKTKAARHKKRCKNPEPKLDVKSLAIPHVHKKFLAELQKLTKLTKPNKDSPLDLTALNSKLLKTATTAAKNSLPTVEKNQETVPWRNDPTLLDLLSKRDMMRKTCKNEQQIRKYSRTITTRVKYLRNEHYENEAKSINNLIMTRQIEHAFAKSKTQNTKLRASSQLQCEPEQLRDKFMRHFNPEKRTQTPPELDDTETPAFVEELKTISDLCDINFNCPDLNELVSTLRQLKNNKASNDVAPEILKAASYDQSFVENFHQLIIEVWRSRNVPAQWGESRLETIFKNKGSRRDPNMYRGLSIGSSVCKVLIQIILKRLQKWYSLQISEYQNGFVQNRGCTDGVFIAKRIQQIAVSRQTKLHLLFVDLTAAFDTITRKWMFDSIRMRFRDPNNILVDILENLYEKTTLFHASTDTTFPTSSGVRQGGPESPCLFNLLLDFVMRVFLIKADEEKIKFFEYKFDIGNYATREQRSKHRTRGNATCPWSGYADDVILFIENIDDMQRAATLLDKTFTRFNLQINKSKTELMTIDPSGEDQNTTSKISINNIPIIPCQTFKYLGTQIHHLETTTGDTEINARIECAENRYASMKVLFKNRKIHLYIRIMFLNSFIRSRLCYNCANWSLTKAQTTRLNASYQIMLRKMIRNGFQRHPDQDDETPDFRYWYTTEDLLRICKVPSISDFISKQQKKYVSHLIRADNDLIMKKLMLSADKNKKRGKTINTTLKQVLSQYHHPNDLIKAAMMRFV